MLEVENLHAYYGKSHILQGVAFNVGEGEIVSLLGRNGVGRSTTCKSIMGLVPPRGSIRFKGEELAGLSAHRIARKGIGYVPEDRLTFSGLSTRENLEMGVQKVGAESRWTIDDAYRLFPRLSERADVKADLLSGGEQQMLSMCRTMMGNPALVMIDEPTEGLDRETANDVIARVGRFAAGRTLVVSTHIRREAEGADRILRMERGRILAEARRGTAEYSFLLDGLRPE